MYNNLFPTSRYLSLLLVLLFISACSNDIQHPKTAKQWAQNKAYHINYEFEEYGVSNPGNDAVAGFDFISTTVTDNDFKELAQISPLLYQLSFVDSKVTDKGIQYLSTIKSLQSVSVGSLTSDTACQALAKLADLRWLSMSRTQVTDDCLITLQDLNKLVTLNLDETKFNGSGFKSFKSQLHVLNASKTNLNDKGLQNISQFKSLKFLHISNTKITDTGLAHLTKLSNLSDLNIGDSKITDNGITELLPLSTQLTDLHLDNLEITDASIKTLSAMKSLKKLYLFDAKLTPQGVERLRKALPETDIHF